MMNKVYMVNGVDGLIINRVDDQRSGQDEWNEYDEWSGYY